MGEALHLFSQSTAVVTLPKTQASHEENLKNIVFVSWKK